jgi:hypothetical protein
VRRISIHAPIGNARFGHTGGIDRAVLAFAAGRPRHEQ